MEENILFINFKNYSETTRENAVPLAKLAEKVSNATGKKIILVVNHIELPILAKAVKIPVFAQHVDFDEFGKGTGKILPEVIKHYGAKGAILNHAENKTTNEAIEKGIMRAKACGLSVMVCAENIERAKQIAQMKVKPDFIAVEPPELIGTTTSVSEANPQIITGTVNAIREIAPEIKIICGAGINKQSDVKTAIKLGTKGVFLASVVVRATDKEKTLTELANGL